MYRLFLRAAVATVFFVPSIATVFAESDTTLPDRSAYRAPHVTRSLLLDGFAVADKFHVVGEHGHILVSGDAGASWTQQDSPTRSTLTGVYFVDADKGWVVGHDAVILRTTDGGDHWEKVYFDPAGETPLLDVWFENANRGIAVGAYGLYLETTDAGTTWTRRPFLSQRFPVDDGADQSEEDDEDDFVDPEYGEDFHLNHITRAANGKLYIAAELGRFYRSDDNGLLWYRMPTDYGGSFFVTIPLAGDALLLGGMRGNLFRSENNGEDLRQIDSGTEALLTSGFVGAGGRVVVAGLAGVVLESGDSGQTFALYGQENRKSVMNVLTTDSEAIVLIGEAGVKRLETGEYKAGGK